jgi:hypothetical protein
VGSPLAMLVVLVLLDFFQRGPGEETGWRGFATALLVRYGVDSSIRATQKTLNPKVLSHTG